MVKFLDRLFRRDNFEAPASTPTRNDPEFAAEVRNLKLSKFYAALEDHLGRPLKAEERTLALEALELHDFENMFGEGTAIIARAIANNFGWPRVKTEEWAPGQDPFLPMAPMSRQINFERGLAEYLGRAPSARELDRARQAFLREDQATRKEFESMVGEEVASYAKKLAYRFGWLSAKESAASAEDSAMRAAAK